MNRSGFSLLEVVLAVTIAAAGACFLYRGISLSTAMQERQRFYQGCSNFLDNQLEQIVAGIGSPTGQLEGVAEDSAGAVHYRVSWDAPEELSKLTRIHVRLMPSASPAGPREIALVTYRSRLLRARERISE